MVPWRRPLPAVFCNWVAAPGAEGTSSTIFPARCRGTASAVAIVARRTPTTSRRASTAAATGAMTARGAAICSALSIATAAAREGSWAETRCGLRLVLVKDVEGPRSPDIPQPQLPIAPPCSRSRSIGFMSREGTESAPVQTSASNSQFRVPEGGTSCKSRSKVRPGITLAQCQPVIV